MRKTFEKLSATYEGVKKTIQEKWEGFIKKFEGTKLEASKEAMSAQSPDDLIALGRKLQKQGEILKAEEKNLNSEKTDETNKYKAEEDKLLNDDHAEALTENDKFDKAKAAEKAETERIAAEELTRRAELQEKEDAQKATELLEKIKSENLEISSEAKTQPEIDDNYKKEKQEIGNRIAELNQRQKEIFDIRRDFFDQFAKTDNFIKEPPSSNHERYLPSEFKAFRQNLRSASEKIRLANTEGKEIDLNNHERTAYDIQVELNKIDKELEELSQKMKDLEK